MDIERLQSLRDEYESRRASCFEALAVHSPLKTAIERKHRILRHALETHAEIVDGIVRVLFEARAESGNGKCSVFAVGGYGRRELCPYSDLDILFLATELDEVPEFAGDVVRDLWDLGFHVGALAHTGGSLESTVATDSITLETTLSARLIAGSKEHETALRKIIAESLRKRCDGFVRDKILEREKRHARDKDTVLVKEPNLKDGPGGLRDFRVNEILFEYLFPDVGGTDNNSTLRVDGIFADSGRPRRVEGKADLVQSQKRAKSACEFLMLMRTALHLVSARKEDTLDIHSLHALASLFGLKPERRGDLEILLQRVYRAASEIFDSFRLLRSATMKDSVTSSRAGGFVIQWPPALFSPGKPAGAIVAKGIRKRDLESASYVCAIFVVALENRVDVDPRLLGWIRARQSASKTHACSEPAARDAFKRILSHKGPIDFVVRRMHEAGFLSRLIPEFLDVTMLPKLDPYHSYTVDEHSLRALENIDRFALEQDSLRGALAREFEGCLSLRLALLLHDIGRGKLMSTHDEAGMFLIPEILARLEVSEDDAREVLFLARHHLEMSAAVRTRDIGDPALLRSFAGMVRTERRLALLLLITICDVEAVGPGTLTGWQMDLLESLYRRALATITGSEDPAELPADIDDETRSHASKLPAGYLYETNTDAMKAHAKMRTELSAEEFAVLAMDEGSLLGLWTCARDRPRLVAFITGACSLAGGNIVSATFYTGTDGTVFDVIRVEKKSYSAIGEAAFVSRYRKHFALLLEGGEELRDLIDRYRPRYNLAKELPLSETPGVRIRDDVSDDCTLIEVICRDAFALLARLVLVIADAGCNIRFAKVMTRGQTVFDTFYVTNASGEKLAADAKDEIRERLEGIVDE
ncbi:MAG: HD domain-containing protein [Planctomycetes bacterium]|nr:HD domain-containing protein [Planctomycetota bacterium]